MVFVIDRLVKLLGVTGDIVIEPVEEEGARARFSHGRRHSDPLSTPKSRPKTPHFRPLARPQSPRPPAVPSGQVH
jgi:hypothetical protein